MGQETKFGRVKLIENEELLMLWTIMANYWWK